MEKKIWEVVELQNELNKKILGENWVEQPIDWELYIVVETVEAINSIPFKHWKQMELDLGNLRMELVDILHFVISKYLKEEGKIKDDEEVINEVVDLLIKKYNFVKSYFNKIKDNSIEKISKQLQGIIFDQYCPNLFNQDIINIFYVWNWINEQENKEDCIFDLYLIKNALNQIRKKEGYNKGYYIKNWNGVEDNEKAVEVVKNKGVETFEEILNVLTDYYNKDVKKVIGRAINVKINYKNKKK